MIDDPGIFSWLSWYQENDENEMADIWGLGYYEGIFWKETEALVVQGNLNPELLTLSFRAYIKTRNSTNKDRIDLC